MRARRILSAVLVSILVIVLYASLFSPVKAPHNDPHAYTAAVSIRGLPENVSTTVYLDGNVWGKYRGGVTLNFLFMEGTTHTVSVDRIVNVTSQVSYICESNVATFLIPGPEYPFNYSPAEPIPELKSPVLTTVGLVLITTLIFVHRKRHRVIDSDQKTAS